MADVLFRFLIGLRNIASQDLAIQFSFHVFRRFSVLVLTTIYNHLKPRLEIYGKSIGVLMVPLSVETPYWASTWRPESNGKHLEFNLALSGKTLLLSAELENISIDTSGDILVT